MSANFGKITAHLAEPIDKIPDELIVLINQNVKPPQPVSAEAISAWPIAPGQRVRQDARPVMTKQ